MPAFDEFDEDSPEFEREIEARIQEMEDGFFYTSDQNDILTMTCNKCGRRGSIRDGGPFPHRADCPMRKL
jgi:uncharacterized OB-fold protein